MIKKVTDCGFSIIDEDNKFNYQPQLTTKLDSLNKPIKQETINEIVLWKVNRYAELSSETINLLNEVDREVTDRNEDITRQVLNILLNTKGIKLPMASTILRFVNRKIYQIIDQRVYRVLYGKPLDLKLLNDMSKIDKQIVLYLNYLSELKNICSRLSLKFEDSDRILYNADKRINKHIRLNNY